MKYIPRYQWGGVYNAPPSQSGGAAQATTSSGNSGSSKKPSTPFKDKMMEMLGKEMLNSDRSKLLNDYGAFLSSLSYSEYDVDPMMALSFLDEAGKYVNYYNSEKKAEEEMKANGSYRDIAMSQDGSIYVQDKETHQIGLVTLPEYAENRDKFTVMRNSDVSSLRSEFVANDENMIATVQRGISISAIAKVVRETTSALAVDALELGVTNEQARALSSVAQGLAEGDYMKYKKEGNKKDFKTYLNFIWNSVLNENQRDLLLATSVVNGNSMKDVEAALKPLFESYDLFTKDSTSITPRGKDGSEGTGGSAGGYHELSFVEKYVSNDSSPRGTLLGRTGERSLSILPVYNFGQAVGPDEKTPMAPYVRGDKFLAEAAGVSQMKGRLSDGTLAVFGGQKLTEDQLSKLVVKTYEHQRVALPVKSDGTPDIRIAERMDAARDRIKKGEAAATVLAEMFPGQNATYDSSTGSIILPGTNFKDFAVVEAIASDRYIDLDNPAANDLRVHQRLDGNTQEAIEMSMKGEKGKYAVSKKEMWWFNNKAFEGNLYIPLDESKIPLRTTEYSQKQTNTVASYEANRAVHRTQEEFASGTRNTNFKK